MGFKEGTKVRGEIWQAVLPVNSSPVCSVEVFCNSAAFPDERESAAGQLNSPVYEARIPMAEDFACCGLFLTGGTPAHDKRAFCVYRGYQYYQYWRRKTGARY